MRPNLYRLRGPWAGLALAVAGMVGLFVAVWLLATLWIFALIGGLVGLAALGWRRRGGWRRLPPPWR
ncbi:MAG: hypothetical protein C4327_05635 [Meiothermus sp.]